MNVRPPHPVKWKYDRAELWADGVIHVLGVGLALAGAIAMLFYFLPNMPAVTSISSGVYLASLVAALGISAVYNIWPGLPTKWFLRRFDHSAIYLLIAGTYTPFCHTYGRPRAAPAAVRVERGFRRHHAQTVHAGAF